jgi:hypothetical protein
MIISLSSVQAILNDTDTIFMKRGTGKAVHISAGACRINNLLCGVTYSRNGGRASYIRALSGLKEVEVSLMCKNCLANVQNAVQPIGASA